MEANEQLTAEVQEVTKSTNNIAENIGIQAQENENNNEAPNEEVSTEHHTTHHHHNSALHAASLAHSAVNQVRPHHNSSLED